MASPLRKPKKKKGFSDFGKKWLIDTPVLGFGDGNREAPAEQDYPVNCYRSPAGYWGMSSPLSIFPGVR